MIISEEYIKKLKKRQEFHYDTDIALFIDIAEKMLSFDEWCTDCKEYDKEKHCCPRFNKVIRETIQEIKENN